MYPEACFHSLVLQYDAGSETLGACRVGNRTRKSTVATFIVANDENYEGYALAA